MPAAALDPNLVIWSAAFPGRSLRETVAAAAASGHGAISLSPRFLARAEKKEGIGRADVPALLAAAGVRVASIESVSSWIPGREAEDVPGLPASPAQLIDLAAELGSPILAATSGVAGELPPMNELAAAFADLCRQAAGAGLMVALEPVAFMDIKDTALAYEIIERADQPNGGLVLDSWHHSRSNSSDEALRCIPRDRVFSVQLVDAAAEREADVQHECYYGRLLPGEGALDLVGYLRSIAGRGEGVPIGAESWTEELARMDATTLARAFADAVNRIRAAALG